jgi:hypothetical protein
LFGAYLRWLGGSGESGLEEAAAACDTIAGTAKALQFKTARLVSMGRSFDAIAMVETMADAWDNATTRLLAHYRAGTQVGRSMARALRRRSCTRCCGSWELARFEHDPASGPEILCSRGVEWIPGPVPVAAALRKGPGSRDDGQSFDFDADDGGIGASSTHRPQGPLRLRLMVSRPFPMWLNGEHILHSLTMFVGHTVDVSTPSVPKTPARQVSGVDPLLDAVPRGRARMEGGPRRASALR